MSRVDALMLDMAQATDLTNLSAGLALTGVDQADSLTKMKSALIAGRQLRGAPHGDDNPKWERKWERKCLSANGVPTTVQDPSLCAAALQPFT